MASFPFLGTILLASLLPLLLVRPALQHQQKPGAVGLLLTLPGVSLYGLATAVNTATESVSVWFVTANFAMLSTSIVTIGWFLLVVEYTGRLELSRPVFGVAGVYVALTQAVFWTNPLHQLVWTPMAALTGSETFVEAANVALVAVSIVEYLFVFTALGLIVLEALTSTGLRQKQSLALSSSVVPPTAVSFLVDFSLIQVNITPLGIILGVLVLAWALFYADFLDITPVGRQRAVEELDDVFFTLDEQDRLIDANPATLELVGEDEDWKGTPVQSVFDSFPALREELAADSPGEVTLDIDGVERTFDVTTAPIYSGDQHAREGGARTVSLRNITELRQREQELREREQELWMLQQVFARVFRHNLRNELGVARGHVNSIASQLEQRELEEQADVAVESIESVLGYAEKARQIQQLVEQDGERGERSLLALVEAGVTDHRDDNGVTILTAVDDVTVRVTAGFETTVKNAVENAIEHNPGPVTVEVTTKRTEAGIDLVVTDDGEGIPSNEITVLSTEEETALSHGSGVGLWLLKWHVETSGGRLDITATGSGTEVRMANLPLA